MNNSDVHQPRKLKNGEKVRLIQRVRRILNTLNECCDEHFILLTALPNPTNHLSLYGSRNLVKTLYNSNFRDHVGKEILGSDKTPVYMPFVDIAEDSSEDEEMRESHLYSKIIRLLDLYNYPSKEHFSYKNKGQQCHLRPKPNFWPCDIKFASLMGSPVGDLIEPGASMKHRTRKDIIKKVLAATRAHYKTFINRVNNRRIDYNDLKQRQHDDIRTKVVKLKRFPTDSLHMEEIESVATCSGAMPHVPGKRLKATESLGVSSSSMKKEENGLLSSFRLKTSSQPLPFSSPASHSNWHLRSVRYEIKRPPSNDDVQENTKRPPNRETETGDTKRVIINGREYAVVDSLDPNETFEEYEEADIHRYPGNCSGDTAHKSSNSYGVDLATKKVSRRILTQSSSAGWLPDSSQPQQNAGNQTEKVPQLLKTVLVQKETGPVLQKYVIRLRKN